MRGLGVGSRLAAVAALAAAGISEVVVVGNDHPAPPPPGPKKSRERHAVARRPVHSGGLAFGNRWGGPHLHTREIARRLRQQERDTANRAERAARNNSFAFESSVIEGDPYGLSRRGRVMAL
jgi:hypothetical protein